MAYSLYTKKLEINYAKLHQFLLIRLREKNMSQRQAAKELNFTRDFIFRLSKGKPMSLESFLKLCLWLQRDLNFFIKQIK